MIAHARDPVVPPSRSRPSPDDLEHVVLRCLAKEPVDRFPDSESLEKAMAEADCVRDWDRDRAAEWWQAADLARRATLLKRL